jgi:hypothetical protein
VDLDAEFARTLVLQDQEEERQRLSQPQRGYGQTYETSSQSAGVGRGQDANQLPYQARVRRNPPRPQENPFYASGMGQQQSQQQQQQRGYTQARAQSPQHAGQGEGNPPGMLAFEEKVERFAEGEWDGSSRLFPNDEERMARQIF